MDDPEFRKRSGMYLGKPTVSGLFMFLLGYSYCEDFNNLRPRDTCPPFIMFLPWVAKQTNQSIGSVNWDRLLLEHNNGDEEKAFNEFFIHYDSFKRQKPIYIQKAIITETEKAFFTAHQEEPWKNKPSDTIYIINYSGDYGMNVGSMSFNPQLITLNRYTETLYNLKLFLKKISQRFTNALTCNYFKNQTYNLF